MRRVLRFLFLLGVLVAIAALAVFVLIAGNPLDLLTGAPATVPAGVAPPPTAVVDTGGAPAISITTSDGCTPAVASDSPGMSAQGNRQQFTTLPNGRPFPGVGPRQVNMPNRPEPDRVLIQFTATSTQQERNNYLQSIRARARRQIDQLDTLAVTLPPNTAVADLPASPIVVSIEPDYVAGAAQASTNPNDPRYAEQWGLPAIGLPQGWAQITASSPTVTVAVIDSGICAAHPDLAGRIVAGYDFVDDDTDPADVFGHGCGVAGVIAAVGDNQVGIAGVAPNARIMPLRVLDQNGLGNYSDIAAAIVYAADNGAQIINLSLAGPQPSATIADAVNYATARGILVIAAAGNSGTEGAWYPAALPSVVAVGAVDPDMQRSAFSNYGADVVILAPGRDILTTAMNGDYVMMTGTSFAAPHVAGIAALARAYGLPLNTQGGVIYLYPPDALPVCP